MRYRVIIKLKGEPFKELPNFGSSSPDRIESYLREDVYKGVDVQEIKIKEVVNYGKLLLHNRNN